MTTALNIANGERRVKSNIGSNALDRYLSARTVTCVEQDRDRFRRAVAVCEVDDEDIGAWLVHHGWALAYARCSGGTYPNH